MMFFDQVLVFWRNLTKKESVESAKYDIQIFLNFTGTYSFCAIFSWIRILIFSARIRIFG